AGFVSLLASEFNLTRESAGIDFDLRADSVVEQTLTLHVPVVGDAQFVTLHGTVWRDDPAAPNDRTRDELVPNAVVKVRGLAPVTADANGEYSYPSVPLALSGQNVVTVFDAASGRQGSFALPSLQADVTNELKLLLQSAVPNGTATLRVHLLSASGASVSDDRVISPGFPPEVFAAKGNGIYEMTVSVPRGVDVWAVPNGQNSVYGDQTARGSLRADFDGQLVVTELRLPGQGSVLAKILVRKPCPPGQTTCPEEYDVAQGVVSVTYPIWDEAEQQLSQSTRTVSTDATSGVAMIAQIPVGAQPSIATVDHPAGYASGSIGPAFDGDTEQIELKLSQLGDATGRVFSFDGQTPIAGASVRLSGSASNLGPVFTGADGSFRFAGVAANQSFRITAEITQDGIYRTGFVDASSPRTGGPVGGLAIVMRQQGSVDGLVVDANGAPIPLAHYWARELAWPYRSFGSARDPLIAGNDGHFFLNNLFSGTIRVSAESPVQQEQRGDWQGDINFENDNRTDVRLQVGAGGTGSVSVTVVDPSNGFALVPTAEVTLLRQGSGFDFTTTDANGVAVFDDVPADFDYSVAATSKRVGRSGSSDTVHLAADAVAPVQVVLDLLGRVSGTLVDGDVTPSPVVKGAPVLLSSQTLNTTTSTGAAGDFLFDGVPEGSFKLDAIEVDSGRHAFSTGDLFISKLFPERSGIQLSLEKTATLNVKTFLPDDSGNAGVLAPAVDVKVTQGATPYSRELQGNDLTFAKLFARFGYHIDAKELGGEERVIHYDGAFAQNSYSGDVALVFPTSGSVQVHVTADDPSLIASARVSISGGSKTATIFSDAAGNASASGFPLGPISIQVTSSNLSASATGMLLSHASPLDVTVRLGDRASVDGFVDAEYGGPSAGTRVFVDVTSGALTGGSMRLDTRTDDSGHYVFAGIPVSGTRVKLTMFAPDDITIGAVIPDQPLPDGTTGTITMPRVRIDATQPRVVGIDPPNNANSVSPNTNIIITFSEPLASAFVSPSYFQVVSTDDNRAADAAVSSEVVDNDFRIRIAPSSLLKSNVVYRVSVSGAVQDLAGHTLFAPAGSSFTTVNYTEPRVIRIDPSVDLPLTDGATFRVKFNKAIDLGSFQGGNGGVAKLDQLDAAHGQATSDVPVILSLDPADSATLVLAPAGVAIQPSSFYRVTVSGARDTQSPPNVQSTPQTFDFFSFDNIKPVAAIVSPVPAGFPLITGIVYTANVAITDQGTTNPSKDVQYVDWFDSDGTTDRFIVRTKLAPFSYNFAAPTGSTYTLKASATDLSNNTSDLASFTWSVSPNAPPSGLALTVTPDSFYLGGHGSARVTFNDEGVVASVSLKITGARLDGSSYDLPVLNQQVSRTAVDAPWPAAQFAFALPPDLKEAQPLHFVATVTDSVNQSASASSDVPLLADSIPPQIVSLTPVSETHYKFGDSYRITLEAKDAESGIAHVTFTYDGKSVDVSFGSVDGSGVATFFTDAAATANNADTRIHIIATAYDFHGNSTPAAVDVIYDSVNDGTIPVAQWLTPLDGAALPAGQSVAVKLRVHATDDVHIEAVQFDSAAFAAPVAPVTTPAAGAIYEQTAMVNVPPSGSFTITATISDSDPSHDVVLPITIDAVAVDQQVVADAAITASNASLYANKSLLVSGAGTKLYITVPIALQNLIVLGGASVGNPDRVKLDVTATDHLYVDGDSSIDLTAKGFLGGWARSEDGATQNNDPHGMSTGIGPLDASGSYGGLGGGNSPNGAYGSILQPEDFGTGGAGSSTCCAAGANGGGAMTLSADRMTIAGAVRADGGSGIGMRYAGSGGSVGMSVRAIVTGPATRITANGGDDDENPSGDAGGGGGRIAISAGERLDLFDASAELQARGGRNGGAVEGKTHLDAGAGTILLKRPGETLGELIVSSADDRDPSSTHQTRATPLAGTLDFDAITIGPRALARFDSDFSATSVNVDPSAVLLAPSDVPAVSLTTTAGPAVIQDTTFGATYSASSRAGIGNVTLSFVTTQQSAFSDFPASVPNTAATISVPFDAPIGASTLHVTATDRAGRTVEGTSDFVVVSNEPPVVDRIDVVPLQTYAGHAIAANVVAHDDVAVRSISLASSAGTVTQTSDSSFSVFIPPDTPGGGSVTLSASVSDGYPNRAPATQTIAVPVLHDPNPPSITITSPAANDSFDVSSRVTIPIRATVVDAEVGVTQVWASIDGGPPIAMVVDTTVPNGWKADAPVPSVDGSDPVTKSIVVFASDYEPNTGQSAPLPIQIRPVFDPNGPSVTWLCPSAGALFPSGYTAKLHVSAIPASPDNGVTSVSVYIGDSPAPIDATSIGNNVWEASVALPSGADGTAVSLKAVATSIRNNVAAVQRTITLASGTTIAADTAIAANDSTYDNTTLIVTGGTTTIDGHHNFARLIVLDGASVTHSIGGTLDIQVAGATYISCSGTIDASGRGSQTGTAGSGGSHGGQGTGGAYPFGSTFNPNEPGGAGDGSGGGIIRLQSGAFVIDGSIAASGRGMTTGGAGGSIRIDAPTIAGSGTIAAKGATGGGGGRIAVYFTATTLPRANIDASGSAAGTVYVKSTAQNFGDLVVDNRSTTSTLVSALTGVGIHTITTFTTNSVTDATADFPAPNVLAGISLIFGNDTAKSWPIVANDSTTITITPDASFAPQTGLQFRGFDRFDSLTLRNANLETADLLQLASPVDGDSASTLVTGNLAPPVVTSSLIAIQPAALGFAVIGRAGAVSDPDTPIVVTAKNARTGGTFIVNALPDGSFAIPIAGSANDAFTLTAKDSHRFPLQSPPIDIGTLPGGTPAVTQVAQTVWSVDSSFAARTLALDGRTLAVASYPVGGGGSSDRLVVLDLTNPAAPSLVRTVATGAGGIRDVVVQNGWAYIASGRFCTLNLTNPSASPLITSETCGGRSAVAVSGGYAFVADTGCNLNGGIWVYDVTNPAAPRFLGTQAVAGTSGHDFTDLQLFGTDYLVGISNSATGRDVMIIDRRDVNALKKISELQIAGFDAFRGVVSGTKLFVVSQTAAQAVVVDLQNVNAPAVAG
ncbi:MAG TPA: Ig-like domain-containing protein, partial [Thermoanaerobaculia bacterium]|nr:Ig-like domain-containing protein [Thermoanaerobaculia bacterium]